jgi:hypothetical protein
MRYESSYTRGHHEGIVKGLFVGFMAGAVITFLVVVGIFLG